MKTMIPDNNTRQLMALVIRLWFKVDKWFTILPFDSLVNRISGVMVSVLAWSAVDSLFESQARSGQTKAITLVFTASRQARTGLYF